ncbi:hypothetical protein Tco_0844444 [Tanacetum coccineum]
MNSSSLIKQFPCISLPYSLKLLLLARHPPRLRTIYNLDNEDFGLSFASADTNPNSRILPILKVDTRVVDMIVTLNLLVFEKTQQSISLEVDLKQIVIGGMTSQPWSTAINDGQTCRKPSDLAGSIENSSELFGRDLESDLERVMVVVDWSSLVEDHPKWLSKDAVQVVVLIGMFWIEEDSFDERSMKSVPGTFLGGFWVEELALEAKRVMIKERILSSLFADFRRSRSWKARPFSTWHDPEDSLFGERDHHVIHKIVIIREGMRMSDANMLKKSSEKHSIGKSHIGALGHTSILLAM